VWLRKKSRKRQQRLIVPNVHTASQGGDVGSKTTLRKNGRKISDNAQTIKTGGDGADYEKHGVTLVSIAPLFCITVSAASCAAVSEELCELVNYISCFRTNVPSMAL
jgi:hypothetical protein